MKLLKPLIIVTAVAAVSTPVLAFVPVIDITAIAHAIIMTANQATQIENEVVSLKNEAANLKNLGGYGMLGALQGEARAIWQRSHAGSPLRMGNDAAAQADAQTQAVDAHIAAANGAARASNGAVSAAQAQALYLDTIASEMAKANALHAADSEQAQNKDDALSRAIQAEAGDGTSIGVK